MKKAVRNIVIVIIGLIMLAIIAISVFTGKAVFEGSTNTVSREDTLTNALEFEDKYDSFKEEYFVENLMLDNPNSNYPLPAIYVREEGNKNVAILVHGMGGTKETLVDVMGTFLDLGFDVIAYDQRNSGYNETKYNTFGILESLDTLTVIDYVSSLYENNIAPTKIALWGESYGALTSVIAAGRDDSKIDYLIIDSPVSDGRLLMNDELDQISKDQGIPVDFMLSTGDWYMNTALGIRLKDADATKWIKSVDVPVLITNSSDDTLTPPYMAKALYDALTHDNKELVTVDGFGHGQMPMKDPALYKEILEGFFRKYWC